MRFLIFGRSHLMALKRAVRESMKAVGETCQHPLQHNYDFMMLEPGKNWPPLKKKKLIRPLVKLLEEELDKCDGILSCLGGHEYLAITLPRHARPFDFVLPSKPDLPRVRNCEIVPYRVVRDILQSRMVINLELISDLSVRSSKPVYQLMPIPPIGDDNFVMQCSNKFAGKILEQGLADKTFRLKMYLLYCDILSSHCRALNIRLIALPGQVFDDSGFLHPSGYAKDINHGNVWYGRQLMKHFEATIADL